MTARFSEKPLPEPHGVVPGYRLECPRQDEFLSSLGRVASPPRAEVLWREACAAVGVAPDRALSVGELHGVVEHIERHGDTVGVIAGAFGIRIRSYLLLSRLRGVA